MKLVDVFNAGENNGTQQTVLDCTQMYNIAMQISLGWHKSSTTVFKSVCVLPQDVVFSQVLNAMSTEVRRSILTIRSVPTRCKLRTHHGGQQFQSVFKYFIIIWMTVPKCSASCVPLCAILSLQDKTSNALQLQPCFTEQKSGCVFQAIHCPNITKVLRQMKFCLHQNVHTPQMRCIFSKYTSKTKKQLMTNGIKWMVSKSKGNGTICINEFLKTCRYVLRIFNSISHRETAEVTSTLHLPKYGTSGFNSLSINFPSTDSYENCQTK